MNSHIIKALASAALVLAAFPASAQLTAAQVFADAPQEVFPLLDHNKRLDMIDYFNSGMATPSQNAFGGESRVTALTPSQLRAQMTDASTYEISLLPTAKGDTIVALIVTVATPAPDSRLTLYSEDFSSNLTVGAFSKPTLDEWLTASGRSNRGDVEAFVPFLLVSYSYNPEDKVLTLTNNTSQFVSADVYQMVSPYILGSLSYKWNGSKFVKQ